MLFSIFQMNADFKVVVAILGAYLLVLMFSFSVHEFAHGYSAYLNGDMTAKNSGRMTINPFAHMDAVGFICLILFGFGWAKPVPINPYYFTRGKKSMFAVSFAGIASNLILAIIFSLTYALVGFFAPEFMFVAETPISVFVFYLLMYGTLLNLALAVFNLLPFYPLDGSKILELWLKPNNKFLQFMQRYSTIIVLLLLIFGVLSAFINMIVNYLGLGLVSLWESLLELIFN